MNNALHITKRRKQGENRVMSHQKTPLLSTGITTRVATPTQTGLSTPLSDSAFQAIISLILCLNLLDAILTLTEIHFGIATEANPMMKALIDLSPALFVIGKTMLVGGCLGVLYLLRKHRQAHSGVRFVGIIYSLLIGWHMLGLNLHFLSI